jgi:SAM-dependent methyltransferase
MASFSATTFSSGRYASFRPTYPKSLFTDSILPYHQGPRCTLIDLGCGPGTVTRLLSPYFARTIGVDPSIGMLATAQSSTPSAQYPSVTYRVAAAEELSFTTDGEADMVVAAQAAHWFDYPRWWKEMSRVVRKHGTVAVWGYKDALFPKFPKASRVLKAYAYDKDKLGPYWSQPGRSIVEGRLRAIRPPEGEWEDVQRWEYEPPFEVSASEQEETEVRKPVEGNDGKEGFGKLVKEGQGIMRRTMKLSDMEDYIRTWSSAHDWKEKHPERKRKLDGGKGDIIDEMMQAMAEIEGWSAGWKEQQVDVAWGHGLILARRV